MKVLMLGLAFLTLSVNAFAAEGAGEGEACGTIAGIVCADGLYCDTRAGSCGIADAGGVCAAKPEVCTKEYVPVCGCDGKTYGNACGAASAGVVIDHPGECKEGAKES